MQYILNRFQIEQLFSETRKEYQSFGTTKDDQRLHKHIERLHLHLPVSKTKNSFKQIFFPIDGRFIGKKLAFFGLPLCDAYALDLFVRQFSASGLVPARADILIVSAECLPDENCFCQSLGISEKTPYDLYIQKENSDFAVFAATKNGERLINKIGVCKSNKAIPRGQIELGQKQLDKNELMKSIDHKVLEFWQKIANNCFLCGSCSEVCPLCFCFHQNYQNDLEGNSRIILESDSCFKKSFSEIQHQFCLKEKGVDRLYNWYHHKFVRHFKNNKEVLCSGCGRCIDGCPAHLNQSKILSSLISHEIKGGNG